jgi:hypothetical protein
LAIRYPPVLLEKDRVEHIYQCGARLSGKLNETLRIGVMDMETAAEDDEGLPAQNYAVVSLQQKVFERSNIVLFTLTKHPLITILQKTACRQNIQSITGISVLNITLLHPIMFLQVKYYSLNPLRRAKAAMILYRRPTCNTAVVNGWQMRNMNM